MRRYVSQFLCDKLILVFSIHAFIDRMMQDRASLSLLLILWSQRVSEYIKYILCARYIINVSLCVSQYAVKKASCQPAF
jgi:hypothetical protein